MTVIVIERVTPALRGLITGWMVEVHAGVFVGTLSARVREKLWQVVCSRKRAGACAMATRSLSEQGFTLSTSGEGSRVLVDYDGLHLLARPTQPAKNVATPRSDIVRIAGEAGVDVRTVASYLAGKKTRPMVAEKVGFASEKLGILLPNKGVVQP